MEKDVKIISESLLEWSLASKNEWLTMSDTDNKELKLLAEKKGLTIPDPDLAILKTYYAEIGVSNRNGVLLEKADVEKALPTLIGKQVNFNHVGASQVCGYIIDAKIEGTMIVAYACIFKSLFRDKFEEVKQKFSNNDLTVSFEIYNINPETGESVVKYLENGTRIISPILFHGMGLLISKPPACPKAKVTALMAEYIDEKVIEEANKIIESVIQNEFVYAEMALPCQNCSKCQEEKKGEKIMELTEELDPNLFLKEDGSIDEEKLEASIPKEVTVRVKELVKEGKSFPEAIKQSWKEYKDSKSKAEEDAKINADAEAKVKADEEAKIKAEADEKAKTDEEVRVKAETEAKEKSDADAKIKADEEAKVKAENDAKVIADEEARVKAESDEKARKEAELAHTAREGNQNFICPACGFTLPLLEESVNIRYCGGCGIPYYVEDDENPVGCDLNPEAVPMNEDDINYDEMATIEDSKKLTTDTRKNLPDSDFALVVKQGDKKVRMYPISDEAHVRNALARLGQASPRATLKSLGVSVETVKRKVLARAKKLGMTDLLSRYAESSSLEGEAILNLSNKVDELIVLIDTKNKELDTVKADFEKVTKDKEVETQNLKTELEQKSQEIATLKEGITYVKPSLSVGSVEEPIEEIKKKQAKIDELAFGKPDKK